MQKSYLLILVAGSMLWVQGPPLMAQGGGGHTLFGDFRVDDQQVSGVKPQAFQIVLCKVGSSFGSRQTVTNNGRYRFMDVQNGDYEIVVESDGLEIARIQILINERVKTDIRRDLSFEWRADRSVQTERKVQTLSATDYYQRPSENKARFQKAQEWIEKQEPAKAAPILEQVVIADPKDYEAWTELGTVYFKEGNPTRAEETYLRALESRSSFLLAMLNLGKLRLAQKNHDGAIDILSRAVETNQKSPDANYLLGEAYLGARKGSKAVSYLNQAILLDPVGKADVHLRLAALYKGAGLKDKAAAEYEMFLAKKPSYPDRKNLEQYIRDSKNPQ